MTLFTMLLVLIAERLFKLGEHWQLDHRLEVLFRRVKHYSMLRTLLMAVVAMLVAFLILQALEGSFSMCHCWWCGSCWGFCASVLEKCVCITMLTSKRPRAMTATPIMPWRMSSR
jgi:hypothetical protein